MAVVRYQAVIEEDNISGICKVCLYDLEEEEWDDKHTREYKSYADAEKYVEELERGQLGVEFIEN